MAGHIATAGHGLIPHLAGPTSVTLAAGIVGATVMPHVIYLHSALTQEHAAKDADGAALQASRVDIMAGLGLAGLVNMAMMIVAASGLRGYGAGSLAAIHGALSVTLGGGAAAAFALALLASSSVGVYAGQVIMEGFLRRRVPVLARRLVTIAPTIGILIAGFDPVRVLILSQVVLTAGLPFALVPLVVLTSRKDIMGALVNPRLTTAVGAVITLAIVVLDVVLIAQA